MLFVCLSAFWKLELLTSNLNLQKYFNENVLLQHYFASFSRCPSDYAMPTQADPLQTFPANIKLVRKELFSRSLYHKTYYTRNLQFP